VLACSTTRSGAENVSHGRAQLGLDAFVPTNGLPALLGTIAAWNPVSSVAAAVRELWGNPNPSSTIQEWPMQHPVAAALIWSILILGVCSVVATKLFRRRTTE
jgi:hypothetical protein